MHRRIAAFAEADLERQAVARIGLGQGFVQFHHAGLVQRHQRLIEGLHAFLQAAVHRFLDLVNLAAADHVADQRRIQQHFHRRQTTAILADDQALTDDGAQVQRQIHQDVAVGCFREEIQHAFQGLVGVVRVQGRQAQVSGFGKRDRGFHRFFVADLADHDDVRRFAHRILQRFMVAVGIQAHLALVDHRLLVPVQVFDRIFDRENVAGYVGVAVVDHRRQRRGFSGTGGTDQQDQAARFHDQFTEQDRQAQLLDRGDIALDRANHHTDFAALLEHIDTETAGVFYRDCKIELQRALELRHLALIHQ